MRDNRLANSVTVSVLLSGCLSGQASFADEAAPPVELPAVFTFSAGYKIDAPTPKNIVELGVVTQCGKKTWCLDLVRYDSAKLLPRVPTRFMHEMHAPYGNGACTNGPVTTVSGVANRYTKIAFKPTADGFLIGGAGFRYRWVADPKAHDGYTLAEISYKNDGLLEQAVGFGFTSSEELKGNLNKADLAFYYKGEIYHKTAFTQVGGPWAYAPSTFDFRTYQEADHGNVLVHSQAGDAAIVRKYSKPMWVQSSIVLARGAGSISPIVQEYGHDFNMDGCFNESGHNKLMLPIGKKEVTALVYVEYTSDNERGFPMMSVGRYYR